MIEQVGEGGGGGWTLWVYEQRRLKSASRSIYVFHFRIRI